MAINTVQGAQASVIIYSITDTARANKLNVYYYIRHLLTELAKVLDENGNIEQSQLEPLMPWSKDLPVDCYSKRAIKRRLNLFGSKQFDAYVSCGHA